MVIVPCPMIRTFPAQILAVTIVTAELLFGQATHAAPTVLNGLPPHQSSYCGALLTALGENHKAPGVSRGLSLAALETVKDFVRRHLPGEGEGPYEEAVEIVAPTVQALWVNSDNASDRQITQVSEQLRSLLLHIESEGTGQINFAAGTQIRGPENIMNFLRLTKSVAIELSRYRTPKNIDQFVQQIGLYARDILTGYVAFVLAPTSLSTFNEAVAQENYPALFMNTVYLLSLPMFSERIARMATTRHWSMNRHLNAFVRFIQSSEVPHSAWIFKSAVYRLPQGMATTLWNTGALQDHKIPLRVEDRITSFQRVVNDAINNPKGASGPMSDIVVVDQLLSHDPLTAEPILTIFVRTTLEEPPQPKRRRRKKLSLEELQQEARLVPIRVTK